MLSAAEEKELLTRAYVPEHLVGLMTCVSGGEPFVIEEYFCCVKGKWLIVVGYPLQDDFQPSGFEMVLERMIRRFRPQQISLIAPQLPHLWFQMPGTRTGLVLYSSVEVREDSQRHQASP